MKKTCGATDCDNRFEAIPGKEFCSRRCSNRTRVRRLRARLRGETPDPPPTTPKPPKGVVVTIDLPDHPNRKIGDIVRVGDAEGPITGIM